MAPTTGTPFQVRITPQNTGLWELQQTEEAAQKASDLLQTDLDKHHVFFNEEGFHNHISHHVLALYGTGAGPEALEKGYDANADYQRPAMPAHERVVQDLSSWAHAEKYLGKEDSYPDFLRFFQQEIDKKGWESVLRECVFKGDEAADQLFCRLFSGFLHPLIQLMYGMEWAQPAIVAEALAQTSVHANDLGPFLLEAERQAGSSPAGMPSIVSLYEAVRADSKLAGSVRAEDSNKVRDGVLARAQDEMLKLASRVRVGAEELEERTAEMFNAAVYAAASAAIHPPKYPTFDFFLIHHVNSAPIFLTINAQPWISTETKVRLLEWKIRMDLVQYAARGVPSLSLDAIASYKPKSDAPGQTPSDVVARLHFLEDDGHAIKLGRAVGICEQLSSRHAENDKLPIRGRDVWMNILRLVVDSVESPGPMWVRTTGLEESWEDVPEDPNL